MVSYEGGSPVISPRCSPTTIAHFSAQVLFALRTFPHPRISRRRGNFLRMAVCLVMYDSGQVSLDRLLLSRHPFADRKIGQVIRRTSLCPYGFAYRRVLRINH